MGIQLEDAEGAEGAEKSGEEEAQRRGGAEAAQTNGFLCVSASQRLFFPRLSPRSSAPSLTQKGQNANFTANWMFRIGSALK